MPDRRIIACLRLAHLKGVGPTLAKRLVEALGNPEAVLAAGPARLAAVEGIGTVRANQIAASAAATEAAAHKELTAARAAGIEIITPDDDRYPPGLRTMGDPPLVLYLRGTLQKTDAVAVGIVGARECTIYGREQAGHFGHDLAAAGLTVISGGARGIDTAAHQGALRAKGRTIVIQGCGLLHTYPPENKALYDRIVAEHSGAVISELPLDAPPAKENFPPRNRIIAGMSLGVLVVEANLRSGSLITARLAAADYGREVFALPGRVDSVASAGTHQLIKTGSAHLVESAADILDCLGDVGRVLAANEPAKGTETRSHEATKDREDLFSGLTSVQERILAAMDGDAITIDELINKTGLLPPIVMAELTLLQIRNAVYRLPANRFTRSTKAR